LQDDAVVAHVHTGLPACPVSRANRVSVQLYEVIWSKAEYV
jgi:hypothetical protein